MTMLQQSKIRWPNLVLAAAVTLIAGCGSDDGGGSGNPAPTNTPVAPTATRTNVPPTATPTTPVGSSLVSGLVVLRNDVPSGAEDALGLPPSEWMGSPDGADFDRALSHADWVLDGPEGRSGTTGNDGRFEIRDLPAGRYTLTFTKTLDGNLASVVVPLVVGGDGNAEIVVEVDRGLVRSTSTYRDGGVTVSEIVAPGNSRVVSRDGQISELGGSGRVLVDPDGDGRFDNPNCTTTLTSCSTMRECTSGICQCTASCPFCDDCGPPVCAPPGQFPPYRCRDNGTCSMPGDQCVCVPSCDDCTDCLMQVCVPSCEPLEIDSLAVTGPAQIRVGRNGQMQAVAQLSNGSSLDVTYLATWSSSDASVASVNNWGTMTAHSVGSVDITASLAGVDSAAVEVDVVERPSLRRIQVEVGPCIYPVGIPEIIDDATFPSPPRGDFIPNPYCRQVVRVGATVSLIAFGEFEDGQFEDITRQVEWEIEPDNVGTIDQGGLFTGSAEGTASVTAALSGTVSDPVEIRVVSQPTLVQLTIYPTNGASPPIFFPVFEDDPMRADAPCFECGFPVTMLRGDELHFVATARYDTGDWEDVTNRVEWRSSDSGIGSITAAGILTANDAGTTNVDAVLDGVTSNPVAVSVVNEATLQYLAIYQEGNDRVVGKGGQAFFRATASYDVGFARDVTDDVTWHSSDDSVGGFDQPGVFTGRAAGDVQVWAELDGVESSRLSMSVFETSDITYCDATNVNRGIWSDAFNRVVLESDCAHYEPPAIVTLRFTVTERERPFGIFDPCLDLFVYQGSRKVRTIRNEGCGEPFLAPGAPDFEDQAPRFQLKAFWDLKDDRGNLVAPGRYTIYGRFYLYFDPVVSIEVDITTPGGRIPCVANACGNGCGYVRACGDGGPPEQPCPAICTELCECPAGWGITPEGDCEPCPLECCPAGDACIPELPPCETEICGGIAGLGCPPGQTCDLRDPICATDVAGRCVPQPAACPEIYRPVCTCEGQTYANDCFRLQAGATLAHEGECDMTRCCPMGADCGPGNLPPCEPVCCPPNARCTPDIPPCNPGKTCCGPNEDCIDLPPCEMRCCPIGALCGPLALPPCEPGDCCPHDATIVCPDVLPRCPL